MRFLRGGACERGRPHVVASNGRDHATHLEPVLWRGLVMVMYSLARQSIIINHSICTATSCMRCALVLAREHLTDAAHFATI